MREAIEKILKNFVFENSKLPHIEIEKHKTLSEGGKFEYVVSAHIPRTNGAFHYQEIAMDIMEKMVTSLQVLGFSKVNGLMIRKENVLIIQALGYL